MERLESVAHRQHRLGAAEEEVRVGGQHVREPIDERRGVFGREVDQDVPAEHDLAESDLGRERIEQVVNG